jgi:hypothetical protein
MVAFPVFCLPHRVELLPLLQAYPTRAECYMRHQLKSTLPSSLEYLKYLNMPFPADGMGSLPLWEPREFKGTANSILTLFGGRIFS